MTESLAPARTIELSVRYAETDASGIVWHGSYLPWLEVGRVETLAASGLRYTDVEAAGYEFPLCDLQMRYLAPARFGDVVTVHTRLVELKSRRFTLDYEVRQRDSGQLLVTARTTHVCVRRDGVAVTIPAEWRRLISSLTTT